MDNVNDFIKKNVSPLKLASLALAGLGMIVNAKLQHQEATQAIDKAVSEQIEGAVTAHMSDVRHLKRENWNA